MREGDRAVKTRRVVVLAGVVLAMAAVALVARWPRAAPAVTASPYTDELASSVPGLSTREIDDLLQGRGAGYARTAELTGYPGPRHVLDLGDRLELSPAQRAVAESLFVAMNAAARTLGAQIVAAERRLSAEFASGTVSVAALQDATASLGLQYGRLRAIHLAAHVELTRHLNPEQIRRYAELRGYAQASAEPPGGHAHGS